MVTLGFSLSHAGSSGMTSKNSLITHRADSPGAPNLKGAGPQMVTRVKHGPQYTAQNHVEGGGGRRCEM